jgi:hypothetical protein
LDRNAFVHCELPNAYCCCRTSSDNPVYTFDDRQSDHLRAPAIERQIVPQQDSSFALSTSEITHNVSQSSHSIARGEEDR